MLIATKLIHLRKLGFFFTVNMSSYFYFPLRLTTTGKYSSDEQSFKILMKSTLSIFYVMDPAFGVLSKKSYLA